MSGTKAGGQAAAATNKKRYGKGFYSRIGAIGAEKYKERQRQGTAKPRGFEADRELARTAGKLGGHKSRRTKKGAENGKG